LPLLGFKRQEVLLLAIDLLEIFALGS
jgi:hypothetical protein